MSFICSSLKHSGLVYVYYPAVPIMDGTAAERCLGTAPDIWVNQDMEGYILSRSRKDSSYANYIDRLEWDTVLKETLKLAFQ